MAYVTEHMQGDFDTDLRSPREALQASNSIIEKNAIESLESAILDAAHVAGIEGATRQEMEETKEALRTVNPALVKFRQTFAEYLDEIEKSN